MSTDNPWQSPETGLARARPSSIRKPRTRFYWIIGFLALLSLIPPLTIAGLIFIALGFAVWQSGYKFEKDLGQDGNALRSEHETTAIVLMMIPSALSAGAAVFLGTCNVTFWGVNALPVRPVPASSPGRVPDHFGGLAAGLNAGIIAGGIATLLAVAYLLVKFFQNRQHRRARCEIVGESDPDT